MFNFNELVKKGIVALAIVAAILLCLLPLAAEVRADSYGEPGAGQLELEKLIQDPASGHFVASLGSDNYRFAPGEEALFKVRIKNTGETVLERVKVNDYLPDFLLLADGQTEIEYDRIEVGETKEFEIKAKIVSADQLPGDNSFYCVVNKVEARTDDQYDEDTAQLCIEEKVLGVMTQPESGAKLWFFILSIGAVLSLDFILGNRKKRKKA